MDELKKLVQELLEMLNTVELSMNNNEFQSTVIKKEASTGSS